MADMMPKKSYDLTEITRLLLEMRENCIPKDGNAYDDPKRTEKYDALNAAIDLINNPSMLAHWISVKDDLPAHVCMPCLIYADGCTNVADWSHDKYEDDWWFYVDGEYDPEVTHWMPLPEPPKEDSK